MTLAETFAMMGLFKAAFPRQPLDEATIRIYADMLADIPADEAMLAARRLLATSEWCPTIAAIRRAMADARVCSPAGELEWQNVIAAIGAFGRYRTPRFDSPLTAMAVDCVGWLAICNSETIGVERAHFLRAYDAVRQRELTAANVGAMEGQPYQPRLVVRTGPISAGAAIAAGAKDGA